MMFMHRSDRPKYQVVSLPELAWRRRTDSTGCGGGEGIALRGPTIILPTQEKLLRSDNCSLNPGQMSCAQFNSAVKPCSCFCGSRGSMAAPSVSSRSNLGFRGDCFSASCLSLPSKKILKLKLASRLKLKHNLPAIKYAPISPVGLFGEKGKSGSEDKNSAWKSVEKAMGSFRKDQSIEEILRQQIEKQEFLDDPSDRNSPSRGGGGGGGGTGGKGGGGGSGGSEDGDLAGILDETLQVILATLGFIFLYVYIISGEEIARLAKDYLKYLFGGSTSVRLRRAMYVWGRLRKRLTEKKQEEDKYWLERAIFNTTTDYDSPEKYRRLCSSLMGVDAYPASGSTGSYQQQPSDDDTDDDDDDDDMEEY
ncbi:hypothetical protein MLD38_035700 [Melastoma candidum]|uniref:Uncharacterized protein n=1 Tax=Melastoma candidum TaxID=119954 RepID=A0ACB9LIC2_9MYRT|nr:hypothetical protein MLD38_035700 [Melastoma candidum]